MLLQAELRLCCGISHIMVCSSAFSSGTTVHCWGVSMVASITTSCLSLPGSHQICFASSLCWKELWLFEYYSVLTHLLDAKYFHRALLRTIIKHFNTFLCFSQSCSLPWQLHLLHSLSLPLPLPLIKENNDLIQKTNAEGISKCVCDSPFSDSAWGCLQILR